MIGVSCGASFCSTWQARLFNKKKKALLWLSFFLSKIYFFGSYSIYTSKTIRVCFCSFDGRCTRGTHKKVCRCFFIYLSWEFFWIFPVVNEMFFVIWNVKHKIPVFLWHRTHRRGRKQPTGTPTLSSTLTFPLKKTKRRHGKRRTSLLFFSCWLFTIRRGVLVKKEMVMIPLGRLGVDKSKDVAQKSAPHWSLISQFGLGGGGYYVTNGYLWPV